MTQRLNYDNLNSFKCHDKNLLVIMLYSQQKKRYKSYDILIWKMIFFKMEIFVCKANAYDYDNLTKLEREKNNPKLLNKGGHFLSRMMMTKVST